MEKMNSNSRVSKSISDSCEVVTLDDLNEILSNKKDNEIGILVTGDCHIASRAIDNAKIISTLNKMTSNQILSNTDSVIINGDLLDRRISLASDEASDYILFLLGLLDRCKRNEVSLDILEGTPSHDNRQPAISLLFNKFKDDKDKYPVRYIDRISILPLLIDSKKIREIFGRELYSLFIPDEVNDDSQVTWSMVKESLSLRSLKRVDMAYMHGTFRYQEPLFTEKSHVEENYESIVNGRIVINHWHLPSAKGEKIRAPGSPERLRHGEEETKGFYYSLISNENGELNVKEYFVINEDAVIFKTLDVSKISLSELYNTLDLIAEKYPDSRIRLQLSRLDEIYPSIPEIKNKYKTIKITEKLNDLENPVGIDFEDIDTDLTFSIRPDNIKSLVEEKIVKEEEDIKTRISQILEEEHVG